jgi:uncharacterized protein (DUF3084 family)
LSGWLGLAAPVLAALLGGGGISWLGQYLTKRRTAPIDNAVRISDASMRMIDQMQEQVADAQRAVIDARREADDARREASAARREMRAVSQEAEELAAKLHKLTRAIHDPYQSLERLRMMLPLPPATNGTS